MSLFNKKTSDNLIVASINGQQCRVSHFYRHSDKLKLTVNAEFDYANLDELVELWLAWCSKNNLKSTTCHWLLSHELYQTYHTEAPNVLDKELAEALKWQIKDQLEFSVEDTLVSYYKPNHIDPENNQIVAVSVRKTLIESLISMTKDAGLLLAAIEIEELAVGHALLANLTEGKIVGYVGENKSGLVFNFYNGNQLVFSRHKKGRFIPTASTTEFSLDSDREKLQDAFLLETQRTLDYVISQLFRKPVDLILLQQKGDDDDPLASTINQLIETPVILVKAEIEFQQKDNAQNIYPTLAEAGCALRVEK